MECNSLCVGHATLKHSCEQKEATGRPIFKQFGHFSVAVFPHSWHAEVADMDTTDFEDFKIGPLQLFFPLNFTFGTDLIRSNKKMNGMGFNKRMVFQS